MDIDQGVARGSDPGSLHMKPVLLASLFICEHSQQYLEAGPSENSDIQGGVRFP